jgi:uncharacterized damage-inducible protein DinB
MTIAQSFLEEFEAQAPITRKFIERLPKDKLTWQPHAKSMTAGQLAYHIAVVPAGLVQFAASNPAQAPEAFVFPQPASRDEILKAFDEGVASVKKELPNFTDAAMNETWRMVAGGHELMAQPRKQFLRDVLFSHIYQHRGQLGVYLRLLDIAVPSTWGPSADEIPPFMQLAAAVA